MKVRDFGDKDYISFMKDDLKEFYFKTVKNNKDFDYSIKDTQVRFSDILQKLINPIDFWKNAAIITCFTEDSYNLASTKIGDIMSDFNQQLGVITQRIVKNMNTRTMVYIIYQKSNDIAAGRNWDDILSRNGRSLFNDNERTKENWEMLLKTKRLYFIVLTEGYVKAGKLVGKVFDKMKSIANKNQGKFGNVGIGKFN